MYSVEAKQTAVLTLVYEPHHRLEGDFVNIQLIHAITSGPCSIKTKQAIISRAPPIYQMTS